MKRLKEIPLNTFQLNVLLYKQNKEDFRFLLEKGVFWSKCSGVCKKGVVNYTEKLDGLNVLVVEGECGVCGRRVARIMEFGENKSFFEKALDFRKSVQN